MPRFPDTSARSLTGKRYSLPAGFEGDINLVIIAFQRWHQSLVDTWLPAAQELAAQYPAFRFYELPTIQRMNPFFRWTIDSGMRSGIPDPAARAATITLYLDKGPFRAALDLPNEETIYALLVNRQGEILWRAEGQMTQDRRDELLRQVSKYVATPRA